MNTEKLEKNRAYVKSEFAKLSALYTNKYILVHNQEVVGSFDSYEAAADQGVNNYGIEGDFLIHYITESEPINLLALAAL